MRDPRLAEIECVMELGRDEQMTLRTSQFDEGMGGRLKSITTDCNHSFAGSEGIACERLATQGAYVGALRGNHALAATAFMVIFAAAAGACKKADPASTPAKDAPSEHQLKPAATRASELVPDAAKDVPSEHQLKPDPAPAPAPNATGAMSSMADALRDADFKDVELFGFGPRGKQYFEVRGKQFRVTWSRSLDAEERSRLRALIDALPAGMSAKCHEPPFGLRFGTGPRALRVSICFRCSNAYVGEGLQAFDAHSAQARELLAFLQARAPGGWQPYEEE